MLDLVDVLRREADRAAFTAERIIETLTDRGYRSILSEGGPHTVGPLLAAGLVDELFLTISPLLVGRTAHQERFGLVEGADLLPNGPTNGKLLSLRRDEDQLFLRYELT